MCRGALYKGVSGEGGGEGRAKGGTYEGGEVLEAVGVFGVGVGDGVLVFQHEGYFYYPDGAGGHECVPEYGVNVGAEFQALRVGTHTPAGEHDNHGWEKISSGSAVSFPG